MALTIDRFGVKNGSEAEFTRYPFSPPSIADMLGAAVVAKYQPHESSTFSRLGQIPKFAQSNAELPFVIVRGELRGSVTLVNSAAKVFHDVTRGAAALALCAA
jgi:hypothetical protein